MNGPRFLMIGGFLGAGKTTCIARLARHYTEQGLRVGLVTNDQANNLVDTGTLRAQGFHVGEVPGACFCCKFSDLIETISALAADVQPDVIIAEPVGSCTDLVATVIEPLRQLHGQKYEIGPLAVLLKPEHGRKILANDQSVGFSPKAAYIFLKQIEEADIVVLNKTDRLSPDARDKLIRLVSDRFPEKKILAASARTGDGFAELIESLSASGGLHEKMIDVDYDIYAEGEAELGWLNGVVVLQAKSDAMFSLDLLLVEWLAAMKLRLAALNAEAAHLKILGQTGEHFAIANLVSSDVEPELSAASGAETSRAELIVNARVAGNPEELAEIVRTTITRLAEHKNLALEIPQLEYFRPGRPVPTHRIS